MTFDSMDELLAAEREAREKAERGVHALSSRLVEVERQRDNLRERNKALREA